MIVTHTSESWDHTMDCKAKYHYTTEVTFIPGGTSCRSCFFNESIGSRGNTVCRGPSSARETCGKDIISDSVGSHYNQYDNNKLRGTWEKVSSYCDTTYDY
jgi:hypothetical protein